MEGDNSVVGFGKEKGVNNGKLGGSDGTCELPVSCGCLRDISSGGYSSESIDAEVLRKIEMLFIFVIDLVSGNCVGVNEREGFNRECLLEGKFIRGFCNLVSIQC
jgi:hypothetical protein